MGTEFLNFQTFPWSKFGKSIRHCYLNLISRGRHVESVLETVLSGQGPLARLVLHLYLTSATPVQGRNSHCAVHRR